MPLKQARMLGKICVTFLISAKLCRFEKQKLQVKSVNNVDFFLQSFTDAYKSHKACRRGGYNQIIRKGIFYMKFCSVLIFMLYTKTDTNSDYFNSRYESR